MLKTIILFTMISATVTLWEAIRVMYGAPRLWEPWLNFLAELPTHDLIGLNIASACFGYLVSIVLAIYDSRS
tara:strand:- start:1968 stop:2183 length:216 start_codon:yes stop_codon:yes gene_type:complete